MQNLAPQRRLTNLQALSLKSPLAGVAELGSSNSPKTATNATYNIHNLCLQAASLCHRGGGRVAEMACCHCHMAGVKRMRELPLHSKMHSWPRELALASFPQPIIFRSRIRSFSCQASSVASTTSAYFRFSLRPKMRCWGKLGQEISRYEVLRHPVVEPCRAVRPAQMFIARFLLTKSSPAASLVTTVQHLMILSTSCSSAGDGLHVHMRPTSARQLLPVGDSMGNFFRDQHKSAQVSRYSELC